MIPTLFIVGLVLGRWSRAVIPAASIGWALVLTATGVGSGPAFLLEATIVGVINVSLGVLVYQAGRAVLRRLIPSHE